MSRVAIIGSCISRDVWRFRGEPASDLLYICRTSLPSLLAPAVAGFRAAPKPPGGMRPKPHRALVADITKTALAELVAFRPTHLIFDFIDERFDLVSRHPWLIGSSVRLEVDNLLDAKPKVRNAFGEVPFSYQPDLLDPRGRTVTLSFRKLFLPQRFRARSNASAGSMASSRTLNSSPLMRATRSPVRTQASSRRATCCNSWSPFWWPSVSLSTLKLSRSMNISAP